MKLSQRSKLSLCQFLKLFPKGDLTLLLGKYEWSTDNLERLWDELSLTEALKEVIVQASDSQLQGLVQELTRTNQSMRTGVSPKYHFEQRWRELCLSLKLDGYIEERNEYGTEPSRFVPIEPIIEGADPVEDDLSKELRLSQLPDTEEIIQCLDRSADTFRDNDFNGCLVNARVALQTLATSIARESLQTHSREINVEKWGEVIGYLRTSGFINGQQESGLTGVFTFISPGSHRRIWEEEFARLGRSLAVTICYFLAKQLNADTDDT